MAETETIEMPALQFSLIQIPIDERTLTGICLVGENYDDISTIAGLTEKHYELPGAKNAIRIEIERKEKSFCLRFDDRVGKVEIIGISNQDIEQFCEGIRETSSYIILLGHNQDGSVSLVHPSIFHMVLTTVYLDGKFCELSQDQTVDWHPIVRSIARSLES